ncbi:MAG: PDZ domain-containing protein [Phycisphaera sp.]|nr:PDZ domain-containing protein [Phycisphaera sp.]
MSIQIIALAAALTAQSAESPSAPASSASASASAAPTPWYAEVLSAQDAARKALYEKVAPSIVTVTSYIKVPDGVLVEGRWKIADESPYMGYAREQVASGILLDDSGLVLCCRSPLALEDGTFAPIVDIETSSGYRFDAELIASEPTINLALVQIKLGEGQTLGDLVPATIGKGDTVELGDTVIAAADPFGATRTFAPGVVMALPTAACYQSDLTGSFIHASMSIAPGSVGGALVNTRGEVVGMLVPTPSLDLIERTKPETHTTFAMQIETALGVGEALKAKRTNDSPWLGLSVLSFEEKRRKLNDDARFESLAKPDHGLFIDDVFDPSPASQAGIQPGDVILSISDTKIVSVVDFQQALYYFSGTKVPIRFFRDGKEMLKIMQIEKRPAAANRK